MSANNKKQFGVWMDTHKATIVGKDDTDDSFVVIGSVKNSGADNNSNENSAHNHEISMTQKFFKDITGAMSHIDEIHVTGTGQIQEQFIKYLADTPQYKNVVSTESTSNRMSDHALERFVATHFNK